MSITIISLKILSGLMLYWHKLKNEQDFKIKLINYVISSIQFLTPYKVWI